MLESLPVFDNDYVATMSRFLDSGSLGNAGVTIVVNGMEVNALNVSASAVQQIRINQDPYSAEYSRPGRGRMEILTKPGGQQYHGDLNLIFRNAHLNAQNVFATTKPLGGAASSKGLSAAHSDRAARRRSCCRPTTRSTSRRSSTRSALRGSSRTVPQPSARALVTGSITHQISDGTRSPFGRTTSTRATRTAAPAARRWSAPQRLQASRAAGHLHAADDPATESAQSVSGAGRTRARADDERLAGSGDRRGRRVHGRRRAGRLLRTETHMNLNESLGWTAGHTSCRRASSFRTGVGADSTTGRISAARSSFPASTRITPGSRTPSPSSRATAMSCCSRSRSGHTSRTTGRCTPASP